MPAILFMSKKEKTNRGHGPLPQGDEPPHRLPTLPQGSQTTILGFGNRLWRDDGAGSILAERLQQANPGAPVFDGGMVPENFLEKVAATKPGSILLVDAGDFGGTPGEYRYFSGEDLAFTGISTHAGSPRMLANYLEVRTGAEVSLLVIQPGDTGEGAELSPEVEKTVSSMAEELGNLVGEKTVSSMAEELGNPVGGGHARDSFDLQVQSRAWPPPTK